MFQKLTEGRLMFFNHEVVPDYLRTKPEPEVEEKIAHINSRVNTATGDLQVTTKYMYLSVVHFLLNPSG